MTLLSPLMAKKDCVTPMNIVGRVRPRKIGSVSEVFMILIFP